MWIMTKKYNDFLKKWNMYLKFLKCVLTKLLFLSFNAYEWLCEGIKYRIYCMLLHACQYRT